MIDVSVIFVNYNTCRLLCDAIESVLIHTKELQFEIIVVDNASSDNAQAIVHQKFGNIVRFVALEQNIGFGRANNQGANIAHGRYLFLLNPDTLLINNAMKILCDYMDQNPTVGVCGGNLYAPDMSPTTGYEYKLPSLWSTAWPLSPKLHSCKNGFNHLDIPVKVGYISGADMMVRHTIFKELKGFDPDFFMYAEEAELTYRITQSGFKSMSVPQAKIVHLEGQSFEFSQRRERMQFEGRRLFLKKTQGSFAAHCYTYIVILSALLFILYFSAIGKKTIATTWMRKLSIIKNINLKNNH